MLERGRHPDLGEEPVGADGLGEDGVHDLERDVAIVLEVRREVHGRHPAGTDGRPDHVAVCKGSPQSGEVVRHVGKQGGSRFIAIIGRDRQIIALSPPTRRRACFPSITPTRWRMTRLLATLLAALTVGPIAAQTPPPRQTVTRLRLPPAVRSATARDALTLGAWAPDA